MTKLITVCLGYYNQNKSMVLKHINSWKKYPKSIRDLFKFYIIDDGSKINCKDLLKDIDMNDISIHIYKIKKDIFWNIPGVINLGAKQCKTPYYIILDMDTLISTKMACQLINLAKHNIDKNIAFKFNRKVVDNPNHPKNHKIHPCICLIRIKDFWEIGGFDEDLVGNYGSNDRFFFHRAKNIIKLKIMKNIFLKYYTEGETNTIRDITKNREKVNNKIKNNFIPTKHVRFEWKRVF
jgi:hypothetical protein